MNAFVALPLEIRLAVLFLMGVAIGTQINRAIYRLAWFPRWIGPWSPPHSEALPRRAFDRLPLLGWWSLRRESVIHGAGYWMRPLLLELATGLVFMELYRHEVVRWGVAGFDPGVGTLHVQCAVHLLLFCLMLVATFIDFDEQTIPDSITLPGTLLGLSVAAAWPNSRALVLVPDAAGFVPEFLHAASGNTIPGPRSWPAWLDGPSGLAIGLACYVGWCVAIMPWTWTMRRGMLKAIQFAVASLQRRNVTRPLMGMAVVGGLAITGVWLASGTRWESLFSALLGVAVGGGTIWGVRIVGSHALGQEAMGFGDVTLMAMIGAFTGWQPTLIIFFLAPFSAIFIAVSQFVLTRRHDIAFGPYLCLSALIWQEFSGYFWTRWGLPVFSLGWFVPAVGITGLLLMGGMLIGWRKIRESLFTAE